MIRVAALALLLAGCASPKPAEPVYLPGEAPVPAVTPLALKDLRGAKDVLIFPDIAPEITATRVGDHLKKCYTGDSSRVVYDPNGMRVVGAGNETRLSLKLAQVSKSSALSVDGPDYSPVVKEELATAVQGRSRCAAA